MPIHSARPKSRRRIAPVGPIFPDDLRTPIFSTEPKPPSAAVLDLYPTIREQFEQERSDARRRVLEEIFRKIDLLADHYGVRDLSPDGRALVLLLYVCREFIPGFRIECANTRKGRGRPQTWDARRYTQLLIDTQLVRDHESCGDRQACRTLIRSNPAYKPRSGIPRANPTLERAVDTLEARLSEARRVKHNPLADLASKLMEDERLRPIFFDAFTPTEIQT